MRLRNRMLVACGATRFAAQASSHRAAPCIAQDSAVDGADAASGSVSVVDPAGASTPATPMTERFEGPLIC